MARCGVGERIDNLELPAALIRAGADVNESDVLGRTALHIAIDGQHRRLDQIVALLLAAGADPTIRDDAGRTSAACAEEIDRPDLAARLRGE